MLTLQKSSRYSLCHGRVSARFPRVGNAEEKTNVERFNRGFAFALVLRGSVDKLEDLLAEELSWDANVRALVTV